MTEPFDEHTEERLRATLRAEADSVSPSPEALNLIRTRTEKKRLSYSWLRPVLAMGAATAIAGSVLLGAPQVREQVLSDFLPASGIEHSPLFERDGGSQPNEELHPPVSETDGTENRGGGRPPAPDPHEPKEAEESPEEPDRTMSCSTPSSSPSESASAANQSDQQSPEADTPSGTECPPSKPKDNGEDDGESGGDGDGGDNDGENGNGDGDGSSGGGENGNGDRDGSSGGDSGSESGSE